MGGSDENSNIAPVNRISNHQGGLRMMGNSKIQPQQATQKNHRRALSNINQNIIGASTLYTCVVHKRGISQKDETHEKNKVESANRSIKRKVAAQLMSNQQPFHEASTDLKPNGLEDFVTVERKEYEEATMDEIDQQMVEEVEMEDVVEEEPVHDIDSSDKRNPLAMVDYIEDIYAYYRKIENLGCVSPNYMSYQYDINEKMRGILIDWLIEVHYKFELREETLFLTVNLIDRFLERHEVARKNLQLVGVTSMLLACKYEEVFVPSVDEFVMITDKAYTRKEVLNMEKIMVNALQFNMSIPTPYVFMRRFLKAAQTDKRLEHLAFFMIELCLVEYEALKYSPSMLAAAAIYTAQCSLYRSKEWTRTSEWHTCYSQEQLMECSRLMVIFHQKAGTGKLTGVHKKYSTCKFGNAAKHEPAQFLLDL
ncbi:hypothetical protein LguiB_022455 [Lonicera macranthoides]